MEYTQEQIDILNEEREKELNKEAAKQLLMELKMLKQKAYGKGTLVSSVLIVQIKQILRGLMKKYNDADLLLGQNITLRLSDRTKYASIDFVYSPYLRVLMDEIVAEIKEIHKAMAEAQAEKASDVSVTA